MLVGGVTGGLDGVGGVESPLRERHLQETTLGESELQKVKSVDTAFNQVSYPEIWLQDNPSNAARPTVTNR